MYEVGNDAKFLEFKKVFFMQKRNSRTEIYETWGRKKERKEGRKKKKEKKTLTPIQSS